MFRRQLIILVISAYVQFGYGQAAILSESMGTTGTSGSSIGEHESNNHFDQTGLTYSGTGDLRTTFSSSGYTGASGDFLM